jgi:hypothetical protein
VAFDRVTFSAHQSNSLLAHALTDPLKASLEKISFSEPVVLNFSINVTGRIVAPGAQLLS